MEYEGGTNAKSILVDMLSLQLQLDETNCQTEARLRATKIFNFPRRHLCVVLETIEAKALDGNLWTTYFQALANSQGW